MGRVQTIRLAGSPDAPLSALFLGAHCDDIEIGCGGTILTLARAAHRPLTAHWVVLSAPDGRRGEAEAAAAGFLAGATTRELTLERFRDGYLPHEGAAVKDLFERLKARVDPDVIFTPYRHDWHQDHRVVNEMTWSTFRDHLILEYEIPKYDPEPGGAPGVLVPIEAGVAHAKADLLLASYPSQASRPWFTRDVFLGAMRLRGIQARSRFAEAFHARKLVLGTGPDAGPPRR
jgi:LmbE family N-acetylglucosaminyl deacetylase